MTPEKKRAWYRKNLERNRAKSRQYAKTRRKKYPDVSRRDSASREYVRNWTYKKKYGLTIEAYEAMSEKQGGRCLICGSDDGRTISGLLVVDHCHTTGKVRGLLCNRCNTGLGRFNDDPILVAKALEYLLAERGVA